jgi:hypothetical protein
MGCHPSKEVVVLDSSLIALLNNDSVACSDSPDPTYVKYRIQFNPPQLQSADGTYMCSLRRSAHTTPTELVFESKRNRALDNLVDEEIACYRVILPATTQLTPTAIAKGILHIGSLRIGVWGDLELSNSLFIWLSDARHSQLV